MGGGLLGIDGMAADQVEGFMSSFELALNRQAWQTLKPLKENGEVYRPGIDLPCHDGEGSGPYCQIPVHV